MPIGGPTSSDAMVPIGGSRLTNCAYPTWCMCTPTPSNPISPKQYRSQVFRDVHVCNSSTWVGGAGWWDNLFCFLLNSGLSVCLLCFCACLTVLCLSTPFALCPAGWLRLRCCRLLVHAFALLLLLRLSVFRAALCLVLVSVWLVRSFPETCFEAFCAALCVLHCAFALHDEFAFL